MARADIDREAAKEEIRSRVDIVDLIGRYMTLKPAGQNMKGLCPFHKEKTPSFMVSPSRQTYHCFGCGKGGDVFSFLMEHDGLTFPEAIARLAQDTGVKLPTTSPDPSGPRPKGLSKNTLLAIHEIAMRFYYEQVKKSAPAIEFFKSRGLSSRTVRDFRLGFAPSGWENLVSHCADKGIDAEALVASGLAIARSDSSSAYDRFRERIMFPVFDTAARPIAFGGRALGSAEPKYLNSPETLLYRKTRTLYGLHKARREIKDAGYVVLVEGYMDFLALYEAGILNCVAASGTAFTADHGQIIRRFCPGVVLLFDGDAAGVTAADRSVFLLAPLGLDVRVLILPLDHDPDSYVREKGGEVVRQEIESAQSGIDFAISHAIDRYGMDTPQAKSRAVQHMAPLVYATADSIVAADYAKRIAERLDVHEHHVISAVRRMGRRGGGGAAAATAEPEKYLATLEGSLIALLIHHPELVEIAMERIAPETFTDAFSMDLYSLIVQTYRDDPSLDSLVGRVREGQAKGVVSRIVVGSWPVEEPAQELGHMLGRLRSKYLKSRMHSISTRLKTAKNQHEKNALLEEQKAVSRMLVELDTQW